MMVPVEFAAFGIEMVTDNLRRYVCVAIKLGRVELSLRPEVERDASSWRVTVSSE